MSQNRKKIINRLTGNLANAILHKVLGEAVQEDNLRAYYGNEFSTSFSLAVKYCEQLNPKTEPMLEKDVKEIREIIMKRVSLELDKRIKKGYQGIANANVEPIMDELLEKAMVKSKEVL